MRQQEQTVTIQPPSTPGGPVIVTQTPVTPGVPQTSAEYRALVAMRESLSDQLVSAAGRRSQLAEELKTADASARPGIQDRLKVLDARIVRLEGEIDRTGDLVARTSPLLMTGATSNPGDFFDNISSNIVPITGMLSVFVFLPIAIAVSRLIWKRAGAPPRAAVADHAAQQRLEQIQQSIDAIAVEVERISEGQRFVSKMLSDRNGSAIGVGVADPLRASMKAAIPSDRG